MLESIISPETAERSPWDMVILGFIVASLSLFFAHYLTEFIPADTSMIAMAICVMALAPLLHRVMVIEEEEEECADHSCPWGFISRNTSAIALYSFLFVGLLAAFCFWYVMLPHDSAEMPSGSDIFALQESVVGSVRQQISGKAIEPLCPTAEAERKSAIFQRLYENNLRVMIFCFLASLLFGAGAIWILSWNASVIAVSIGSAIKVNLEGLSAFEAYCLGFPAYSLGIAAWAVPELMAYFCAAVAGGIASVAVIRHHFMSEKFWLVMLDAGIIMLVAALLVFVGSYIEHFFV
jgi:hypothetical protein